MTERPVRRPDESYAEFRWRRWQYLISVSPTWRELKKYGYDSIQDWIEDGKPPLEAVMPIHIEKLFRAEEKARERGEEEPAPRACIIATVFLGKDHPFLPPMRKFRDKFIPKRLMELYYRSSVFVLRKIGKCPPS